MVAHACHPKNVLFLAFFLKKNNKKTFQIPKKFYFRFENTFVSHMFSK